MSRMLAIKRQQQILHLIQDGTDMSVGAMAAEFGVTTETVRRDLKALESAGRVRRVYGGAVPVGRESPPLADRVVENAAGKQAIGRLVAGLVTEDQAVYMSSGSTVLAVARELVDGPRLTVMTHMPPVAETLAAGGRHKAILTGGVYDPAHRSLTGEAVPEAVVDRIFDLSIVGAYGLDPDFGLVDEPKYLFTLKRRLKNQSRRCIWVADRTKFGRSGLFQTLPFEALDVVVTDVRPPETYYRRLTEAGVELLWPGQDDEDRTPRRMGPAGRAGEAIPDGLPAAGQQHPGDEAPAS